MQNRRRKKESDLLRKKKKISGLTRRQPAKEQSQQSPDTRRTDSGLRAVKMDRHAEGRAGQAPTCSEQTPVWWLRRWTATPRVVPSNIQVPTHSGQTIVWGLWRYTATPRVKHGTKKILGKQQMAAPKVVTKKVSHYTADRLRYEGCEDRQQPWRAKRT